MDYRVKVKNHWNAVPCNSVGGIRLADIVGGTLTQLLPEPWRRVEYLEYDANPLVLVAGEACKSRGYEYELDFES